MTPAKIGTSGKCQIVLNAHLKLYLKSNLGQDRPVENPGMPDSPGVPCRRAQANVRAVLRAARQCVRPADGNVSAEKWPQPLAGADEIGEGASLRHSLLGSVLRVPGLCRTVARVAGVAARTS